MSAEPAMVRCIILEEREISLHIEQEQARGATLRVWIPRSQLDHISKRGSSKTGFGVDATIEMPEWLANDKGLDYA